jgi:hypothetical protein
LALKILDTIFGRSVGFKLSFWSKFRISGQFGLQVNVIKKSGKPTAAEIAIPSKYNASMYLWPPTKEEGNTTLFPFLPFDVDGVESDSFKVLYYPTRRVDWLFLNQLNLSASIIVYPSTKNC